MKNAKMTRVLMCAVCILLSLTLILVTGCNSVGEESSSDTSTKANGNESVVSDTTDSGTSENESVTSTASNKTSSKKTSSKPYVKPPEVIGLPKITLADKKIIRLSHTEPDDFTKRMHDGAKRDYGLEIETVVVPYNNLAITLAQKINAGEQLDLAPCRNADYPIILQKGYAQEIDKYIDLTDKLWAEDLKTMNEWKWKGKYYMIGGCKPLGRMIFFNTTAFKKAGLPTPLELYNQGKWDWNALLDLAKELTLYDENGNVSQYGFAGESPQFMLHAATGEDYIKFDKNGIVNNFRSPNIAKAEVFLQDLILKHKVTPPFTQMQDFNLFAQNKVAMGYYGSWYSFTVAGISDRIKSGGISFAPAPKMPGASKPRYEGSIGSTIIPTASKNPKGAAAYLIYQKYYNMTQEETQYGPESPWYKEAAENWGWSKEMIQVYREVSKAEATIPLYHGIGSAADWAWEPISKLTKGTPWATIVEEYAPKMQQAIDQFMNE